MNWKRRAVGGWTSSDGAWTVRGPMFGKPMFWLYYQNHRYTPTGRYDDAVRFNTAAAAKKCAEVANLKSK